MKNLKVYSFFIFFLFLVSMELWIGWGEKKGIVLAVFGVGALLAKVIGRVPWEMSLRNILLCAVFYIGYYLIHPQFGLKEFFTQIPTQLVPICCIVFLRDDLKPAVLRNITKWFAWLMVLSIPLYFITSFVEVPNLGMLSNGDRWGTFGNYIFFVKEYGSADAGIARFGGPFLEPGYLGMMGAFLLFANLYDFKKKSVIIILFSTLLSFSLAGWVLAFIGYLFVQLYREKINFKWILGFVFFMLVFIGFGLSYNRGDNLINNEILRRLVYDEVRGFAGNNRNVMTMTVMFLEMWGDTNLILHGYPESAFIGLSEWETIGAGLDRFMVFHGLLGVFYVFMFYLLSLFYAENKKFALLFFILIIFCFWQRTYALWFSWIICFHYSVVGQDKNSTLSSKKRKGNR